MCTLVDQDIPYTTFLVSKPSKKERELSGKHPTVKPVELLRHLIRLTTKPGQTVLDPFLGSGTTCVAAILEGRRCIGIEIHKDYLNISLNRINLLLNGEANAMEYPLAPCWGRSC